MRNILLTITYDGAAYSGWQLQPDKPTIAREIMRAMEQIMGKAHTLYVSGRTDAGVHALMQTANFYTDSAIPAAKLVEALNAKLPRDIVILSAKDVAPDFNARASAKGKTYTYVIYNDRYLSPFYVGRTWHVRQPLDIGAMNRAARILEGTHDFKAFMAAGSAVTNTVRTVYAIEISKKDPLIKISVSGNGFLYNMVRIIAGTLVYAASGKLSASDVAAILESRDRTRGAKTAPPDGLYLAEVRY